MQEVFGAVWSGILITNLNKLGKWREFQQCEHALKLQSGPHWGWSGQLLLFFLFLCWWARALEGFPAVEYVIIFAPASFENHHKYCTLKQDT